MCLHCHSNQAIAMYAKLNYFYPSLLTTHILLLYFKHLFKLVPLPDRTFKEGSFKWMFKNKQVLFKSNYVYMSAFPMYTYMLFLCIHMCSLYVYICVLPMYTCVLFLQAMAVSQWLPGFHMDIFSSSRMQIIMTFELTKVF